MRSLIAAMFFMAVQAQAEEIKFGEEERAQVLAEYRSLYIKATKDSTKKLEVAKLRLKKFESEYTIGGKREFSPDQQPLNGKIVFNSAQERAECIANQKRAIKTESEALAPFVANPEKVLHPNKTIYKNFKPGTWGIIQGQSAVLRSRDDKTTTVEWTYVSTELGRGTQGVNKVTFIIDDKLKGTIGQAIPVKGIYWVADVRGEALVLKPITFTADEIKKAEVEKKKP